VPCPCPPPTLPHTWLHCYDHARLQHARSAQAAQPRLQRAGGVPGQVPPHVVSVDPQQVTQPCGSGGAQRGSAAWSASEHPLPGWRLTIGLRLRRHTGQGRVRIRASPEDESAGRGRTVRHEDRSEAHVHHVSDSAAQQARGTQRAQHGALRKQVHVLHPAAPGGSRLRGAAGSAGRGARSMAGGAAAWPEPSSTGARLGRRPGVRSSGSGGTGAEAAANEEPGRRQCTQRKPPGPRRKDARRTPAAPRAPPS
jgi:hypothetical protein